MCRFASIIMEIIDLSVLSDSSSRYDTEEIQQYCFRSGFAQLVNFTFENLLVVWYSYLLVKQVQAPTENQSLI